MRHWSSLFLARTTVCLALLNLAGPVEAGANDLVNSTFDENLDGWTVFGSPDDAVWDPLDAAGSPDSGSALLSQDTAGFVTQLGQCVPVTADEPHSMSSLIFVPGGQNADGRAFIEMEWFSSLDCSPGDWLRTDLRRLDPLIEGGWSSLAMGRTAPAEAVAVNAVVGVKNNDGVFRWEAHFDNTPFGLGILPGLGFALSASGEAAVEPDGQGNFTVSNIGNTLEDGVDIRFGAASLFEADDLPIITAGTLDDGAAPSGQGRLRALREFRLEQGGPISASDVVDGATLQLNAHVLLPASQTRGSLAGAVSPSDIRRTGLQFVRTTQQDSFWLAGPVGADLFPQLAHELVLKSGGQVVVQESGNTDPLRMSAVPRRLGLGIANGRLEFHLKFDDQQIDDNGLSFDEAIFRSEGQRQARDMLPAVQLRASELPAVQLADADLAFGSVRIRGLGQALVNLRPEGGLLVENFGGSGGDGFRVQAAGEPSTRARLEFGRSVPASDVSGAVEAPAPCLMPGEPLARFEAADIGAVFEVTAEFFGTAAAGATASAAQAPAVRQSDPSTLRIFSPGDGVTEVAGFTGAVRTSRSLGNAYTASVCDGDRLCNEFRWEEPITIEVDGAGTFTANRLIWILGNDLEVSSVNGVEYFAADMPARDVIAASADDRVFVDDFEGSSGGSDSGTLSVSAEVVGNPQIVFDWTTDRCEEGDIPDLPVRAFRDADGRVQLVTGHPPRYYRLIGDDLASVARDCSEPVLVSGLDKDPAQYDFKEWMGALYTFDGQTIHALVHSEFHGWEASDWHAEFDFSGTQDENNWRYEQSDPAGTITDMTYHADDDTWKGDADFCHVRTRTTHPGDGCDAVRTWVSPINDTVDITGETFDLAPDAGDGVVVTISHGGAELWEEIIENGDTEPVRFELFDIAVDVGDRLEFQVEARANPNFDSTFFNPKINRAGDPCPSDERGVGDCLRIALTHAQSSDAGDTYDHTAMRPELVANPPVVYEPDGGTLATWQPSNIVRHPDDGMYYALVQRNENLADGSSNVQGTCVIRTDDPSDPASWRAWDGHGFDMRFVDPYREPVAEPDDHWCTFVSPGSIGALTYDLSYNKFLDRFVAVGVASNGVPEPGFYFSFSEDLIDWSERELLLRSTIGGATPFSSYPTLIDPDDTTRNFERPGRRPYLYYTRFNSTDPADRDLLRVRVRFDKE